MHSFFLILTGLLGSSLPPALPPTAPGWRCPQVYSAAQLQADLRFVRKGLKVVHPGLYCYTPKDSLDRAFARVAAQLTHPLAASRPGQCAARLPARPAR